VLVHASWKRLLLKADQQKTLKIVAPEQQDMSVQEIDISLLSDQASESSAEPTGQMVDVRWSAAPDTVLFTHVYPSSEEAQRVFDDLVKLAAEVEGLIRSEDMDAAKEKSKELAQKFKSNSSEPPISPEES